VMDVTVEPVRTRAAFTLLRASFAIYTRREHKQGVLMQLMKFMALFNVQHLRKLQFLDEKCSPTGFSHIAAHLRSYEPGNLLFTYILQSGVLHRLTKQHLENHTLEERIELKSTIVNILAHLFTNKQCPLHVTELPALSPLPEPVRAIVEEYNAGVDKLLIGCLQLASPSHQVQNPVFALTGKANCTSSYQSEVVSAFDEDLMLDGSFIPTACLELKDHRGQKIHLNSYASDFYRTGDRRSLMEFNKIPVNEIWYLLNDFNRTLDAITQALEVSAKATDPVFLLIKEIASEFNYKFKRSFQMRDKHD